MCACRLESQSTPSTPGSVGALEDYYPFLSDVSARTVAMGDDTGGGYNGRPKASDLAETEDLYTQLAEKERDLMLAAELGKALLEQNDELKRNNEQIVEEYNQKLEELTQEKHALRLRLEAVESEYETTVRELQNDIGNIRHDLEEERSQARSTERSKSQVVTELTQQNERLNEQLKKISHNEEQLLTQVSTLRAQVASRRTSMHEHVHQLQVLRDEINMLSDRKTDLEKRMMQLTSERDCLSSNLEDAQDRIMMLERQKLEQEQRLRNQDREFNEIQEENSMLHDKVDSASSNVSSVSLNETCNSLFSELEMTGVIESMSGDSTDSSPTGKAQAGQQVSSCHGNKTGDRPHTLPLLGMGFDGAIIEEEDIDDIECDDEIDLESCCVASEIAMGTNLSPDRLDEACALNVEQTTDTAELKQEILEVYGQLQQMVLELKGQGHHFDPESVKAEKLKSGCLLAVLRELRELMEDVVSREKLENAMAEEQSVECLETQVHGLRKELMDTQDRLDNVKVDMHFKDMELKRKSEELIHLTNKLSLQQEELGRVQEERDRLQDNAAGITKDDIVDQARAERNQANEKKNDLEMELAKSRLDLMALDTQLMDTINQKLELSQQLEMWQCDMQDLLDTQLTERLEEERRKRAAAKTRKAAALQSQPLQRKRFHFPWRS